MCYTNSLIFFTRVDDEEVLDVIPLHEIVGIDDMESKGITKDGAEGDSESVDHNSPVSSAFQIRTDPDGYNRWFWPCPSSYF